MDYRSFKAMHLIVLNLTYERSSMPVFEPVSFEVKNSGLVWLQGENGAGKTTLLRTLAGLNSASAGSFEINGCAFNQWQHTREFAPLYVGHNLGLNPNLTAVENLNGLIGLGHGLEWQQNTQTLAHVLGQVGLAGKEDIPARLLSAGQRKRIVLAQLLWAPVSPIWILDEPFSAMDVQAVGFLIGIMARHLSAGGIIIFSSHNTALKLAHLKPKRVTVKSAATECLLAP